ncbi:hypothetical protein RW64_10065 [Geobacter sulfurreducens]|nr:hypothetical protein RW64_10065 [Geobacter sulfurreducens]
MLLKNQGLRWGNGREKSQMLYRKPYVTIPYVARELRISSPAASKAVNNLAALGILIEVSGKKRDRVFLHESYLSIIREGTELYR